MLEAIVQTSMEVKIVHSLVPTPKQGELSIKVICSGCNPKDWKAVFYTDTAMNSGDDIAGIVESVGPGVSGFKKGDRVAAFHPMGTPGGSYAEFAIAPAVTTFHLPDKISFEEASTMPLPALTAVVGLYHSLGLPPPWAPATKPTPLLIYGASTTVGAYAIKLASRSNLHPIIAVAGAGRGLVEGIIDPSKGDVVVDHREGHDTMVKNIRQALKVQGNLPLLHAFDCVSGNGSLEVLSEVVTPNQGSATFVLHEKDYNMPSKTMRTSITFAGYLHTGPFPVKPEQGINYIPDGRGQDFAFVYSSYLSKALEDGWLKTHPYKVVPGGLSGLPGVMKSLRDNKVSAFRYVIRIADTKVV
ncbi:alcohol dehydrogenase-like protein [Cadophora sp. MPI-SDFR-AT-0126]|nr:alcohol dehydrogenase-like protein [Leotiomycetes sp. MPI-SDFR-AT-0126]